MTDWPLTPAWIRPAQLEDADALVGVQRAAELAGLSHIFPPHEYVYPVQAVAERWRTVLAASDMHVLLAEGRGEATGLVGVAPGWLNGLFVVPSFWGSGLADQLHDAAITNLRVQGHARCRLWVLEGNHRARRFYERHAWRPDGGRQATPFPPYPDEVRYEHDLG